MEKNTPHYDLAVIQAEVVRLQSKAFTLTAREGGRKMMLNLHQMIRTVCLLKKRMLYKSMTTYADHRVWQDVYHTTYEDREIYIKVTYRTNGGHPIISFKERNQ
ncbi:type II toxin-antitoxin system MqsR family toxin [Pseudomonas fluorescens]|uniref:type II toxin-antitoxin system MqsR family toxin n=1 Tax=Pseudomonas fluorescens TaxID=294 RepID=UPI0019131ED0|nr:type II toxin-antitoxin system MqsR family toxin [Pseudomonas fluorescens]